MLLKVLNHALMSDDDYEKTLKVRRNISALVVVLGIAVLVIVNLWKPKGDLTFAYFLKGMYTGTGFSFAVLGMIDIIKKTKLLKDPEKMKKSRIKEKDERQTLIAMKTSSAALMIMMGLEYFALLLSGMFNSTVFFTLLSVLMVLVIVMIGCKFYYSRRI